MENIVKLISTLCSNECVFSCFKDKCPRGSWCEPDFVVGRLPQVGSDSECPLMQFEAKKLTERTIRFDSWDLLSICEVCKYSEVTGFTGEEISTITTEKAYEAHCMDCPVRKIRDDLSEKEIEKSEYLRNGWQI